MQTVQFWLPFLYLCVILHVRGRLPECPCRPPGPAGCPPGSSIPLSIRTGAQSVLQCLDRVAYDNSTGTLYVPVCWNFKCLPESFRESNLVAALELGPEELAGCVDAFRSKVPSLIDQHTEHLEVYPQVTI
jgi:hypothetical protein